MSCLLVRARSCTPASTVELTDWLEGKVAQLREETPGALVRLTRLVQDLPAARVDDGWLIEVQTEGEGPGEGADPLTAALEEVLCDMRILGLDPTLLVPRAQAPAGADPAQEPLRREDLRAEDLRPSPLDSSPANSSECSSRVSRVRRMCSWLISEALQGSRSCSASRISRCSE